MLYFEEDIPLDVKIQLRDYWHAIGLEDRLGIDSCLMAERVMVWHMRHPHTKPAIGWDARLSVRIGAFCATVDDGLDMLLYVTRPFGERVPVGQFVQAVYGIHNFMKERGVARPETLLLMAGGMAQHELVGPRMTA
jgi:hypothetical protein